MAEPTVVCPQCRTEIKLTESLAAPLLESIRRDYEQRLTQKDTDMAKREKTLHERETVLQKQKESMDEQVAQKIQQEQARIAAEEAKKAKLAVGNELNQKLKEINDLHDILKQRDIKLADAQKAQADVIRKQRELDDAKRELELTVEKRVQTDLAAARVKAKKEAEDEMKLKVMEAEQTIASMQRQIEDLKRRAEQGSQQLQGEVQELELEALLGTRFPRDTIQPVPKGEFGGDILHRVIGPLGQQCGTILWESKRTKNWSDGWLPKLREDQRTAKAEVAVIISQVLPKNVETFGFVEDVWVAHPRVALPIAISLRQTLIEVAGARQAWRDNKPRWKWSTAISPVRAFAREFKRSLKLFLPCATTWTGRERPSPSNGPSARSKSTASCRPPSGCTATFKASPGKHCRKSKDWNFRDCLTSPPMKKSRCEPTRLSAKNFGQTTETIQD